MKFIFTNPKDFLYIDYMVNPIPAFVIFLMAINDHYLKYHFNGFVTGKLSDFCGMFYFPLLLCATYTLLANLPFKREKKQKIYITKEMMLLSICISATLMLAIKLNSDFTQILVMLLNKLGFQNQITQDPTDLISLSVIPLSYWYAQQFFREQIEQPTD